MYCICCIRFSAYMINTMLSPRRNHLRVDKLSQIVVWLLEIMFMVVAFSKTYPACQTDDNGIKPGSNLTNADKRAAGPSRAEFLGIK